VAPPEVLTFSPADRAFDRWLARTLSGVGAALEEIRDRLYAARPLQRHHLVLDLSADTGLLTWEALRRVPEGGVWALTTTTAAAQALRDRVRDLPELRTPHLLTGPACELRNVLDQSGNGAVRFDFLVGRNVLSRSAEREACFCELRSVLAADGVLALAETAPRLSQRLSEMLNLAAREPALAQQIAAAEAAIYADPDDPLVSWEPDSLATAAKAAGFATATVELLEQSQELRIPESQLQQWFADTTVDGRPSYARRLLAHGVAAPALERYRKHALATLSGATVRRRSVVVLLRATVTA
jgi:putative ATPase